MSRKPKLNWNNAPVYDARVNRITRMTPDFAGDVILSNMLALCCKAEELALKQVEGFKERLTQRVSYAVEWAGEDLAWSGAALDVVAEVREGIIYSQTAQKVREYDGPSSWRIAQSVHKTLFNDVVRKATFGEKSSSAGHNFNERKQLAVKAKFLEAVQGMLETYENHQFVWQRAADWFHLKVD